MTAREVELTGGAPWGFRMHGGADQNQPLRISRVSTKRIGLNGNAFRVSAFAECLGR